MSHQSDWTPAQGLAKATLSLTLRATPALILWCGLLWFHAILPMYSLLAMVVFGIISGVAIAIIMTRRLAEQAGMVGLSLIFLAALAMAIVLALGVGIMSIYCNAYGHFMSYSFVLSTFVASIAMGIKNTVLDD